MAEWLSGRRQGPGPPTPLLRDLSPALLHVLLPGAEADIGQEREPAPSPPSFPTTPPIFRLSEEQTFFPPSLAADPGHGEGQLFAQGHTAMRRWASHPGLADSRGGVLFPVQCSSQQCGGWGSVRLLVWDLEPGLPSFLSGSLGVDASTSLCLGFPIYTVLSESLWLQILGKLCGLE